MILGHYMISLLSKLSRLINTSVGLAISVFCIQILKETNFRKDEIPKHFGIKVIGGFFSVHWYLLGWTFFIFICSLFGNLGIKMLFVSRFTDPVLTCWNPIYEILYAFYSFAYILTRVYISSREDEEEWENLIHLKIRCGIYIWSVHS